MATQYLASNPNGSINKIPDCWINLADTHHVSPPNGYIGNQEGYTADPTKLYLYALPEITDAKTVNYTDQTIPGRAAPVKNYSYSSNRTIDVIIHLYVTNEDDINNNLQTIRKIAALAHPEYDNTYLPPRIARIKCGKLLSDDPNGVPVVLKTYSVAYESNVQWFYSEAAGYMPLHVQITTSWDVVYSWVNLPGYLDVLKGAY